MKYLEELSCGDCFIIDNQPYLLTHDFKNDGSRLCYSLVLGNNIWLKPNTAVDQFYIYGLDNNNNIYPIKPTNKSE